MIGAIDRRRWWGAVLAIWCVAAFLYWWTARADIAARSYPDVDDLMRLMQVRDWLAGQSWFDLTQYRVDPPGGVPMHWSRWVDLPIAAAILAARPFLGPAGAELFACVVVPLVTLAAGTVLTALLACRLLGPRPALVAAMLAPFTIGTMQQMHVLRIDHHGWQIVLAVAIVLAALDRRPRRSGLVAGGCAALWLAISLEGLPFVAAAGALFGLRWLLAPDAERERFAGFAAAVGAGGALLHIAATPPAAWGETACDALSAVHVVALAVAAGGALLAIRFASAGSLRLRLGALAATGAAALLAYRSIAPQCGAGALGLDPLVQHFWYMHVLEGLPLWRQDPNTIASSIGFPLLALIGTAAAWRASDDRPAWRDYGILLAAAALVTLFVQRAGGAANLIAVPGGTWLLLHALGQAQRIGATVPRVLASATVGLALTPMSPGLAVAALPYLADRKAAQREFDSCTDHANYATAALLPRATLFTPLDIGPGVAEAGQKVVATGHHRNRQGMHDVIAAFLADPAAAEPIVRRHGAAYILVCPHLVELDLYREAAPHGLWAELAAGRTPPWLRRVTLPGSRFAVWRVVG